MVEENPNPTMQEDCREDDLEDDTFSLSGFSTFRDSTTLDSSQDLLNEDHSFEFFTTEEWNNNNTNNPFPPESIVFCGNLIPLSKQGGAIPKTTQNLKDNQVRQRDRGNNPSSMEKPQSTKLLAPVEGRRINNLKKGGGKNNVLAHKVSILRSSSTKSNWQLYMLGMAPKVPGKMELSDIRSRQSRRIISPARRSSSKLLGTVGNGTGAINREEGVSVSCSARSVKGLWGLIRVLGCHDLADTVIKASLVRINGTRV